MKGNRLPACQNFFKAAAGAAATTAAGIAVGAATAILLGTICMAVKVEVEAAAAPSAVQRQLQQQ